MEKIFSFIKEYKYIILGAILILLIVGGIELSTGRSFFGPDGKFGFWEADVWSSENSQRVADAYSFSHIIHGIAFYAFLWLVARRVPMKYRFLMALAMEGGWELLENSPIIIDRYRAVTISLGYVGDSVLNSVSDVLMVALGFYIARFSKFWVSVMLVILMEVGCLFWVRDNLTLNIIMLAYPLESIKDWQSVGHIAEKKEIPVKLYYYNPAKDQGPGGVQCTRAGLVAVDRIIPETTMPLTEAIKLLLRGEITADEKAQGVTSEFPLAGVTLTSATIVDGVATLTFDDPQNKTGGGSCRIAILWAQIEATAKQFPTVTSARFLPEELFQP